MRASARTMTALVFLVGCAAFAEPITLTDPADGIASVRIQANAYQTNIHVTFTRDMIPLGGGSDDFPVALDGPGKCNWGWRGPRTLSCLLGASDTLPMAHSFALVLRDGLLATDGTTIPPWRYEFETERPTVSSMVVDWEGAVSPLVHVTVNVPVAARDLERHAAFVNVQSGQQVAVRVSESEHTETLASREPLLSIRAARPLEADSVYRLEISAGLSAGDGGLASEPHVAWTTRTHDRFEFLGVACSPEPHTPGWQRDLALTLASDPDCAAESPVALIFSAEPELHGLYEVLLQSGLPATIARTVRVDRRRSVLQSRDFQTAKTMYAMSLHGFAPGSSYRVELPATIRDRFGRGLPATRAEFPVRDYVPAFLNDPGLGVIAAGSGKRIPIALVNSQKILSEMYRDDGVVATPFDFPVSAAALNDVRRASIDVEELLGKPWGAIAGNIYVNHDATVNTRRRSLPPPAMLTGVGAIVSPWDVVVSANRFADFVPYTVWVSDFDEGLAVQDATVELLAALPDPYRDPPRSLTSLYRGGTVVGSAVTDQAGFAEIVVSSAADHDNRAGAVRVTKAGRVVVLPLELGSFAHRFDAPEPWLGGAPRYAQPLGEGEVVTWGMTDKPLYRRGETVRIKGYARQRDDNRFRIPGRRKGWPLSCMANGFDLCAGETVDLDEYGAFEFSLPVPDGARDGEYAVRLSPTGGRQTSLGFRVSNFRPAPHKVTARIAAAQLADDDKVPVDARAEYFAGGGVANAEALVSLSAESDAPPRPEPLFAGYFFGSNPWTRARAAKRQFAARFDAAGRLAESIELPDGSPPSGKLTVTVAAGLDNGQWATSDPVSVPFVRSRYSLGVRQDERTLSPERHYVAGVVVIDLKPDDPPEDLRVVQTLEYETYRHDGGSASRVEVADECSIPVRAGVELSCDLQPTRLGWATVRARLLRGTDVLAEQRRGVEVALRERRPQWRTTAPIEMTAGADRYASGDTAEVDVELPWDEGTLLLTARRNVQIAHWRETFRKGRHRLRIPLGPQHAPGFTLTAIALRTGNDPAGAAGRLDIDVRPSVGPPTLVVEPGQSVYRSGDTVTLELRSGAAGRTQLAVAVIDDALLDLVPDAEALFDPSGERLGELLSQWTRYAWWQLGRAPVDSADGGGPVLEEIVVSANAPTAEAASAMMSAPAASMRQQADGAAKDEAARKNFSDTAFFAPAALTSTSGVARFSFEVPDNLGRWRVIAIGADTAGRLFAGQNAFDVSLPLEARMSAPQRALAGDTLGLRGSVLNRKTEPAFVEATLVIEGGETVAGGERSARLEPMESLSVLASSRATAGSVLKATLRASDSADVDAVEVSVPVHLALESRSWTSTLPIDPDHPVKQPLLLPKHAIVASATLQMRLDKSVIGDLTQAFHYMAQGRHRSWEHILSRAVVAAYADHWEVADPYRLPEPAIRGRLVEGSNFQGKDGGMHHFLPLGAYADDYLSAYTAIALRWLAELGYAEPRYAYRLHDYLRERVRQGIDGPRADLGQTPGPAARDMPIMIAALAGGEHARANGNDSYLRYLRRTMGTLDAETLAWAVLAAREIPGAEDLHATLTALLKSQLVETFDRMEIAAGGYRYGNLNETYCNVLDALQRSAGPDPRTLAKLVRGTLDFRSPTAGFGNTHANAQCLRAMTYFRDNFESRAGEAAIEYSADRLPRAAITVSAEQTGTESPRIALPLKQHMNEISAELVSGQRAYASTNVAYDVDLQRQPASSQGYTIRRQYFVHRDGRWQPVTAASPIRLGDWIKTELTVNTPLIRRFVAITDATPAGFEPVDPALSSSIPPGLLEPGGWWRPFSQRALSNERSRFYAEWLWPGEHRIDYYSQARFTGTFLALPAKVESMYSDGVFATGDPATVTVGPPARPMPGPGGR